MDAHPELVLVLAAGRERVEPAGLDDVLEDVLASLDNTTPGCQHGTGHGGDGVVLQSQTAAVCVIVCLKPRLMFSR